MQLEITIRPTDEFTNVRGAPCRVWQGVSPDGVPCLVYVSEIAVPAHAQSSEFDAALQKLGEGPTAMLGTLRGPHDQGKR